MAGMISTMLAAAMAAAGTPQPGAQLQCDLATLAADAMEGRGTGTPGAARALAYIEGRLRGIGLEPHRQGFEYTHRGEARQGVNLWARVPGRSRAGRAIVVTAHYDHVGVREGAIHNGADDNASGVAALLAIAADLKANPPEHDVIPVALDAEEIGLYGSKAFVASPPVAKESILLNVNMDMVSRGKEGVLWAVGTGRHPALRPVVEAAAQGAPVSLRLGHDEPGTGGEDWTMLSDQGPFHAAGIPFVYFGVDDHPDYHKASDDVERIDAGFYRNSVATILDTLRRLDGAGEVLERARAEAGTR
jgi:Zn-dependent M28 family amino/carboxypeptidase